MAVETITKYESLFAVRTGVTVLLPKQESFNDSEKTPPVFKISPENQNDIIIQAGQKSLMIKGMKKEHLEAAVSRGFILFYEMDKNDDVVRCTQCNYLK